MKRIVVSVLLAAALSGAALADAARFVPPRWLRSAERSLLKRTFENAKPIRVYYIAYPKKIAVIFEFDHVVICGLCDGPSNASIPRGRVIRVSFDRQTHSLSGASNGWAMRFCEVDGIRPPKRNCLRR